MNSDRFGGLDALIVFPPLSPNGTNPPLGPAILRTALERQGVSVEICDLNRAFLEGQRASADIGSASVVGDHDKNRAVLTRAREAFRRLIDVQFEVFTHVPPNVDPLQAAAFDFDELERCVELATASGQPIRDWLEAHLFRMHDAPRIVGVSIMGPSFVFIANVIARLAREFWPRTIIIGGGTHVTVLSDAIQSDSRFGRYFDGFFVGHCENEFAAFVKSGAGTDGLRSIAGAIVAGEPSTQSVINGNSRDFEPTGTFDQETFGRLSAGVATLPAQLTRGCSFARCRMCTYPAIELMYAAANEGIEKLVTEIARSGCRRVSFKDAFVTKPWLAVIRDRFSELPGIVEWSATTMIRESLLEDGFLAGLFASGCRTLEFGVETIHPRGQAILDKPIPLPRIRSVVLAAARAGIHVIVNLIYGLPGETLEEARRQLRWFRELAARVPGKISGSHNLLEINLRSKLAANPEAFGIELRGRAPWAFSFEWNAPAWTAAFKSELARVDREFESTPVPTIVLVTGPGGAGKTTLTNALCDQHRFSRWLSLTTRSPRVGSSAAPEYEHGSEEDFERRKAAGDLLEWEVVGNFQYGLPWPKLLRGTDVAVAIVSAERCSVVRKAMLVRGHRVLVVFVDASDGELDRRMRERGDSEAQIQLRIGRNARQRELVGDADLVLRDVTIDRAVDALLRML